MMIELMEKENKGSKRLQAHALGMIGILIVQYLLGMTTNLFVQFPENAHEGQLWVFAWHQIPLSLHIIVGFALLFGTISLIISATKQKNRSWIIASTIAGIAIFSAIGAGATFIPTQTDAYSFVMAISFIISLLAYFWGLYKNK